VKPLTLETYYLKPFTYDIVVEKKRMARIIVFLEEYCDEITIRADGNKLYIIGCNGEEACCENLLINLWFKIRRINYKYRNGVLTIDALGKKLFFI